MNLGDQWVREVAPGVFRLGTTYVGCYAVEDRGAFTFVDTGLPGYWRQLVAFMAARGRPLDAIEAVVLTHHHADHAANAERLRTQAGAGVMIHPDDLAVVMGKPKIPRFPVYKPHVLRYIVHVLRSGGAGSGPVAEASTFLDEEVLDVPGRPRVIHTPGHTPGHAVIALEDRNVVLVGDAIGTIDIATGETGPRLMPRFSNADHEQALASLARLEPLRADWVLPSHGLPWAGTPRAAVQLARENEARRHSAEARPSRQTG